MTEELLRKVLKEELKPVNSEIKKVGDRVELIIKGLVSVSVITPEEAGHVYRNEIPDKWLSVVHRAEEM